jgi:uncharacterized protein involved in propanediol utilization
MTTRPAPYVQTSAAAPALAHSAALAPPAEASAPGIGRGLAAAHHGELFQGQIRDRDGRLRRCLVSLPCPNLSSTVTFQREDSDSIVVIPSDKRKVLRAIETTMDHLGERTGGVARVVSNIAEGKGYGSSTADCVAAVRATANAFGERLMDDEVARIVVRAETASDNTMFDRAVLFAQREGVVLEDFGTTIPPLIVLGVDMHPDGIVDTLTFPPAEYSAAEVQEFHTLVPALRRAIRTQDAALLARVATVSSRINERYLPKPQFPAICRIAEYHGALGVAVAHSGTLVSLLFQPSDPRLRRTLTALRQDLDALGLTHVTEFHTRAWSDRRQCAQPNLKPHS